MYSCLYFCIYIDSKFLFFLYSFWTSLNFTIVDFVLNFRCPSADPLCGGSPWKMDWGFPFDGFDIAILRIDFKEASVLLVITLSEF